MDLSAWHIWIICGILLLILEIFTVDFLFAAFASACAAAGIAAASDASLNWQVGVFIIVAVIVLLVFRPIFRRHLYKKSDPRKTNIDAMIGRLGTVIEIVGPEDNPGRVRLGSEEWRSVSDDGAEIAQDARVEVTKVSGATLTVKSIV